MTPSLYKFVKTCKKCGKKFETDFKNPVNCYKCTDYSRINQWKKIKERKFYNYVAELEQEKQDAQENGR